MQLIVNQKQIPIWIADYVLASYGTGAIMAFTLMIEIMNLPKFDLKLSLCLMVTSVQKHAMMPSY